MSDETFKIGDVVVLKSGGPDMTITSAGDSTVRCKWFLQGGTPTWHDFPPDALKKPDQSASDDMISED